MGVGCEFIADVGRGLDRPSHPTYVETHKDSQVPGSYRTPEGYGLGQWVSGQRGGKDTMSAERRQRLEALTGWVWNTMDAAWEEGYGHLTTYAQAHKDARVPRDYTAEGYRLGRWVSNQRSHKDSLSAERRERLEALDGWVWPLRRA